MINLKKFLSQFSTLNSQFSTQKGMSLIEVLVASVILVLTVVAVMSVSTSGFIVLKRVEMTNRAVSFAKEKIDEIQNMVVDDIYPADCPTPGYPCSSPQETFDKDGIVDGYLTEQPGAIPPVIGSDAKIVCPRCGAVTKAQDVRKRDGGTLTNEYYCPNDDMNNDGVGGDWCGGGSQTIVVQPDIYRPAWTYTKLVSLTRLPCPAPDCPGSLGWFTRIVRVRAFSIDETTNVFENYDFAGQFDPKGERAPVKQVTVDVRWAGLGEGEQSYKLQTLISRAIPKYVSREMGR